MQSPESSSTVRSCHQTRCHQLDEDSRKPRPSGSATTSMRWRSTGMTPRRSCQLTGAPTRHGSASKGAPSVGSVIRTNGASSRLMPPTVDTAAHTSERLARSVTFTLSRIAPLLRSVPGGFPNLAHYRGTARRTDAGWRGNSPLRYAITRITSRRGLPSTARYCVATPPSRVARSRRRGGRVPRRDARAEPLLTMLRRPQRQLVVRAALRRQLAHPRSRRVRVRSTRNDDRRARRPRLHCTDFSNDSEPCTWTPRLATL